ncbi:MULTISPECIES: flavodoxin [unclassified Marinimicrobium]|jgi:flavodoxin|uniref:flavodoxin n=1 Tax=unclassified Marinimicrobium TaxID=2632100 RepID=UPI002580DAB1|nr:MULTISPECIES: flavodoxin [unclassified Marinimicrobium]|tara:strand:+ start:223 stop:864 length:642 start_codon:yes stop_codon:yes gene_type:complete
MTQETSEAIKAVLVGLILLAALLGFASNVSSEDLEVGREVLGDKVLIVYLSRTQNTKAVADIIQEAVGGDSVALELETPYPEDYDTIVAQVDEENETGYLPPLKTEIENIDGYDTVFVGFPTWDMQMPPPMKSFLHENNLSGKRVIPFNTHGGYGVGSGFETVEMLCSESTILEGFSVKGGLERDGIYLSIEGERKDEVRSKVHDWLERIEIL